ncbi:GvpL/GvpF family gas vesicle protein [Kitasatospora sp. NBC_00374]|uniref:GvpL/GvpF family gas vesicle protein n=1 Tax=Kitasatospora sp. NBC_00374 TaxID=2975964 RepID=UPI0030E546A3
MALYVYSVTAADHPNDLDGLTGVGDPPTHLRTLHAGPLSAVVSEAPENLRPKRRDLAAHQAVQERLMTGGTVLPLRFGLTAPDDAAVRAALLERAAEYENKLAALADCCEYHLKASQNEESLLRQILRESDEARKLNDDIKSGAADPELPLALGQIVAQEVQARQEAMAAGVIEALRPLTRQERVSAPTGDDFLNVSFLVDSDHDEKFRTEEQGLAAALGENFDLRLRGPLPAYSFV